MLLGKKVKLEQEILDNAWLTAPADLNILFKTPIATAGARRQN